MSEFIWALGLMSGTSLDGIDAALIKTDGESVSELGPSLTLPYEKSLHDTLHEAVHERGDIARVEREMTLAHAQAVRVLLAQAGVKAREVGVIGFHGQTIAHRPKEGITRQIGDGALLARETGIDVVNDFRSNDVCHGGQGAPLVPLYHAALVADGHTKPLAVLNIGGVSNVTYIAEEIVLAFDTGPGNAPLNDWMRLCAGKALDEGGQAAIRGRVHQRMVERWLANPFFDKVPPKSLDRNDFPISDIAGLSLEDGAATLTAFIARSIARAVEHFPSLPNQWFITGGGRHNPVLMGMLTALLKDISPVEAMGWDGDALEAQAFAYLAVRSRCGLPLSLPTTTGVSRAVTGGAFYPAARALSA
ncbi:MAG: anhydro-N-acetylmuramic acid kinase [Alphaproteobacteria bacterium]|nr:anhydro-N-acetylmuramic acid kinase [Alphaproteobacteria bacterium]